MIKVLQICECFAGGNFSSVTQICNGLAARGHQVHLGYSRRPETPLDVSDHLRESVVLHELRMTRSIDLKTDAGSLFALLRLMRKVDPDVIHLHSSKAGFLGRIAGFLAARNDTVFYSPRGLSFLQEDFSQSRRNLFKRLEWGAARLGGTVIACSQGELERVCMTIAPRSAILIENAVDVAMVSAKLDRQDETVRIGTAGRICAARNPGLFATLARRLRVGDVEFVWIGGGDEDGQRLLEDAGVHVTGWRSRKDALARLAGLDIYLQTSLWEGMPIAVIEAQVAGIPAVVTDILGNRDIVRHGETGFVCHDEDEMTRELARLVAEPEARAVLGRRARELALGRFSVDRLVDELLAAYVAVAR